MTARALRLAVNQFPYDHLDPLAFLVTAARSGFAGVGLSMGAARRVPPDVLRAALNETGLVPTSLCVAFHRVAPDGPADGPDGSLGDHIALAAALGAPLIVMPQTAGAGHWHAPRLREALRAAAEQARTAGTKLLVEPVNPVLAEFTAVTSVADAAALLAAVPGLGVVLDLWHSWRDPDLPRLLPVLARECQQVHVSDYRFVPDQPLSRVMIGDGLIDLRRLTSSLTDAGFAGWWEAEVLEARPCPPDRLEEHLTLTRRRLMEVVS